MRPAVRVVCVLAVATAGFAWLAPSGLGQEEAPAPLMVGGAYVIAPGDVLDVAVYDEERLSGSYRVDVAGNIFVPDVGAIRVAGYSIQEAQARLTEALKAILKRPVVTMRLNEASSMRRVSVVGAVNNRGTFDLPVGATVMTALAQAQGFSEAADPAHILLLRATGEVRELDLSGEDYASLPDARIPLQNGDTLSVPISRARITVLGPVKRPGRFAIRPGARPTILEAISEMAQGLLSEGDVGTVTVLRDGEEHETIDLRRLLVDADLSQNVELQPGDIVYVNEPQNVGVVGAVNMPTSFAAGPRTTVVSAISRAGSLTPSADLANAKIRRGDQTIPLDLKALWLEGDMDHDVRLMPGDVVVIPETSNQVSVTGEVQKPGAYPIRPGMRVASVIGQAGGPTERGDLSKTILIRDGQPLTLDLQAAVTTGKGGGNIAVQSGDVINVPPRAHMYVMGAVVAPGPVPVRDGDTVMDALADAGGTNARANTKRMILARREADGTATVFKFDMPMAIARSGVAPEFNVRPGDVIFVPRRGDKRAWQKARDAAWILTGIGSLLLR